MLATLLCNVSYMLVDLHASLVAGLWARFRITINLEVCADLLCSSDNGCLPIADL